MTPQDYIKAAEDLRKLAARLEQRAQAETPAQRHSRTLAVHAIAHEARTLYQRHNDLTFYKKPNRTRLGGKAKAP